MPNKPIIEIDVNDEQFKSFYEHYKEFHEKLEEMPDDWKAIHEASAAALGAMADHSNILIQHYREATDQNNELVKQLKEAKEAQRQFALTTGESGTVMKKLGLEAKELKETLFSVGSFLTKLGVLGLGALTGAFFGMDKLAEAATGGQRQARGLGMTTGQLNAFKVDFGTRYADESVLQGVADARSDLTKQWALQRATGLNQSQIQSMDLGELTGKLMLRAHDIWQNTPANQRNEQLFAATGLEQSGVSFDQYRQMGNTSRKELTDALGQYMTDRNTLGFSDASTDKLYVFQRDLDLAGKSLQSHLIDRLSVLGPSMGDFTKRLEKDGEKLLDEVLTPENLGKLEKGLNDLTTYLGGKSFQKDLEEAGHDIQVFAHAIDGMAKYLDQKFPQIGLGNGDEEKKPAWIKALDFGQSMEEDVDHGDTLWGKYVHFMGASLGETFLPSDQDALTPSQASLRAMKPHMISKADVTAYAKQLGQQYGLPWELLTATIQRESDFNANAIGVERDKAGNVTKIGGVGLAQINPDMAAKLGVKDLLDWKQSMEGEARMYKSLQAELGGNMDEMIAGYNTGGPNVRAAIAKAQEKGGAWSAYLLPETQKHMAAVKQYLDDQMPSKQPAMINDQSINAGQVGSVKTGNGTQQTPLVKLTVYNQSGSNIAVSTNAAAAS
uniref:Transglycosylase SLT domain-containing protein n=1 Tax=Mycena chlorophos TaxID=658473 RepID=A0ABQ0KZK9_MYCCL|nr:predicted protein [Mycena chlorophos]